jgi:hypothetical protein
MNHSLEALPEWARAVFPDPGRAVLRNVPEEVYHATKGLISKSALDEVARSLAHYRYSVDAEPEPDTTATIIGRCFHTITLEPDLTDEKIVKLPDFGDMRSSKNRDTRDAWLVSEGFGRTPLKPDDYATVVAMRDAVHRHPAARKLMRRGESEVTALWTDPATGLRCKSRADRLVAMDGVFVDLKSANDASPEMFARAAANFRYHVQDAFYSRAFEENDIHIENFVFVVVEKEPPYAVAVYQLDDTARRRGEQLYMREMRALAEAILSDRWPGYGDAVMPLALPKWATPDEAD